MMITKSSFSTCFTALFLALLLSACAGTVKHMQTVAPGSADSSPDEGKAMIVFMRPSGVGSAVQSSVFEIVDDKPSLAGIVAAKMKFAHQLEPGEHLFMVIGENADFMYADLEANKTYYTLIEPRWGAWKARFSFRPIRANEIGTPQFNEWIEECSWVEKSSSSDQWASENMASILSKQQDYFAKWMSKDSSERLSLMPQDGK